MQKIEELLSLWWVRIIAYFGLSALIYFILNNVVLNSIYYYFGLFIVVLIPSIIIERLRATNNFYLFGIMINSFTIKELSFGIVLAILNMLIIFFPAYLLSESISTSFYINSSVLYLILNYFLLACFEEMIFRGVIFQAFYEKFGKELSVIIFAIFFALVHFDNLSFNWIFFMNLCLAGILLALMYLQTKSLFLPISFHFAWNLIQQLFLASPVSGNYSNIAFVDFGIYELNPLLFGGYLGVEAGIIVSILMIINIFIVIKFAKISPMINAKLYKRYYAESKLLYNKSRKSKIN